MHMTIACVRVSQLYKLMNPMAGVETAGLPTIDPLWLPGEKYSLFVFLSGSDRLQQLYVCPAQPHLFLTFTIVVRPPRTARRGSCYTKRGT